jgi:hypothetical protein
MTNKMYPNAIFFLEIQKKLFFKSKIFEDSQRIQTILEKTCENQKKTL